MGISSTSGRIGDAGSPASDDDPQDVSWLEAVDRSFVFVWCDAGIGTQVYLDDFDNTLRNIAGVVNRNRQLVHTFNDIRACQEFITHVNNVCLIVSGSFGEELVPKIHNLEQVRVIYVFCVNKAKHQLWASHYRKVSGVYTKIGAICDSLKSYVVSQAVMEHDRVEYDICNNEMNLSEDDETDICLSYAIFTKTFLTDMTDRGTDQGDMIYHCREEYTSKCQVQMINDFERNYSQFDPVWWFTKNHFFQGIVNRALRARDLHTLCCMQRFIKDLELKLAQLYQNLKVSSEPLNLYFSQILTSVELERLESNRGQLLCINQFVFANTEKAVSLMFIEQQKLTTTKPTKLSILFQIHIDRTIEPNVHYANIGSVSEFVHEQEYLLSMFSVYRIGRVEQIIGMSSTWLVTLTLLGKDDLAVVSPRHYARQVSIANQSLADVGYSIKDRLSLFKSSHKLFKRALKENRHELRTMMLHHNMAIIYDALGDNEKSLEEHRTVLTMARSYIPACKQKDDVCLASVYSNMGLAFQQNKLFKHAFEHAYRALQIVSEPQATSALEKDLQSACYVNFGTIHAHEGKITEAGDFYGKALQIRQSYLPLGHRDITALQRQITTLDAKSSGSDSRSF